MNDEFREVAADIIARLAAKEAPRKVSSTSECRFCPISREYYPDRMEL